MVAPRRLGKLAREEIARSQRDKRRVVADMERVAQKTSNNRQSAWSIFNHPA